MAVGSMRISESLQILIDSRLDTIDRMLLGRVLRQERMEIVREVELQVYELLQERDSTELTRDDVLAVLAQLDPPEAYLPEEMRGDRSISSRPATSSSQTPRPRPSGKFQTGKLSGILGLVSLSLAPVLGPFGYASIFVLNSEIPAIIIWLCAGGIMFLTGIIGVAFAVQARLNGPWAIAGAITSAFSILSSFLGLSWLFLELLA
jgi:hypothetical protein